MNANPEETRNGRLAAKLIANLERRHYEAHFCPTSADVVEKIRELIPQGSSVSWGGSMSVRHTGVAKMLKSGGYEVYDREDSTTEEEKVSIYRKAFECDFYLGSANAISQDGVVVNIDGNGNRVAAMSWGPRRVILIVGLHKVCENTEAALSRARCTAAPVNMARFDFRTPCQQDGLCHYCKSPDSICNYISIQRMSHPAKRHIVILTSENVGY